MNDISEWYTPDRALAEDVQWILAAGWKKNLAFLRPLMERYGISSIVEVGCGSGLLAAALPVEIDYLGIDSNQWFVERAQKRCRCPNERRHFKMLDVRHFHPDGQGGVRDLAMAWTFFKHFSLDEWDERLLHFLSLGRHAAFNVPLAGHDFDNGREFHHVFVVAERLAKVIDAAGHDVVEQQVVEEFQVGGEGAARHVAVWTSAREVPAPVVVEDEHG